MNKVNELELLKGIRAKVKITGELHDENGNIEHIDIVKFDMQNNVIGFNVNFKGKKIYVGAGKDAPKLTDVQNLKFVIAD